MNNFLSLTPGFSTVQDDDGRKNRFNGFTPAGKPLKRLISLGPLNTRLKPGVNETDKVAARFSKSK